MIIINFKKTKTIKTLQILKRYLEYNYWANELILTFTEKKLNDEEREKEIVSSFSSLKKTIYHLWDAEFIWLKRLKGESLNDWPSKNFNGTFSETKEKILLNDQLFIDFVERLNDEKLSESFSYKNIEGKSFSNPRWESVHHCMNHSTYHRGQIVTMLRQLGITNIPSTDFISFCRK